MAKNIAPEYTGPIPDDPTPETNVPDPDKFKNLISKVEASDQTPEKKKRHLSKQQEEGEDEKKAEVAPTPTSDFRSHFTQSPDDSPFKIKTPQNVSGVLPKSEPAPVQKKERQAPQFDREELVAMPPAQQEENLVFIPQTETPAPVSAPLSKAAPPPSHNYEMPSPSLSVQPAPTSQNSQVQQNQNDDSQNDNSTQTDSTSSTPTTSPKHALESGFLGRAKKNKRVIKNAAPANVPVKNKIDELVPSSLPKPVEKEVPISGKQAAPTVADHLQLDAEPKKAFPPTDTGGKAPKIQAYYEQMAKEKHASFDNRTKEEAIDASTSIGGVGAAATEGQGGRGDQREGRQRKEPLIAEVGPLSNAQAIAAMPDNTPPPPSTPAWTRLSPQTLELFERMVAFMGVEKDRGVSTTTVKLNMPNSVFNDAQIVIKHYSTAPHAFNIQLMGSPKAVELFNANLPTLAQSFKDSQLPYEINLQNPSLLEEFQYSDEENPKGKPKKGNKPVVRKKDPGL